MPSKTKFLARELSKFVGSIISISAVLGRFSRTMTRHYQVAIAASSSRDKAFELDSFCLIELKICTLIFPD